MTHLQPHPKRTIALNTAVASLQTGGEVASGLERRRTRRLLERLILVRTMNLAALRSLVEREIDTYVYEVPGECIGTPCSSEWVATQLTQMRASLVEPRWVTVQFKDSLEQINAAAPSLHECVLIADDHEGYELYYDPEAKEFVLAYSSNPPVTFNVRGDAVGCFMAR